MRFPLAGLLLLSLALPLLADEKDSKRAELVAAQKKTALDKWKDLEVGEGVQHETAHLIVMAPKALEKTLKETGNVLEKCYEIAAKLLYTKPDEEVFPGKLTVFLLAEPKDFDGYLRRVEKQRVMGEDVGYVNVSDDKLRVAASPPRAKGDPTVGVQAAQQVATAVLQRKVGFRNELPLWFAHGFGRATYYQASGGRDKDVIAERKNASKWATANKRTIQDTWNGNATGEEANALGAGTVDFLAYGPGKTKFATIVEGFKPDENEQRRTIEQALQTAELTPAGINAAWNRFIKAN